MQEQQTPTNEESNSTYEAGNLPEKLTISEAAAPSDTLTSVLIVFDVPSSSCYRR